MTVIGSQAARELVQQAHDALLAQDGPAARTLLEQAARSWAQAGDRAQQQWCARAAASLARYQARDPAQGPAGADDVLLAAVIRLVTAGSAVPGELAGVQLVRAAEQISRGDRAGAALTLRDARTLALEQRDAGGYFAVMVAQATLADACGDRAEAYQSLATGWATLGDAIGPAAAQELVAPALARLRDRWGAQAFAEVKARYEQEARQRREHGRGQHG